MAWLACTLPASVPRQHVQQCKRARTLAAHRPFRGADSVQEAFPTAQDMSAHYVSDLAHAKHTPPAPPPLLRPGSSAAQFAAAAAASAPSAPRLPSSPHAAGQEPPSDPLAAAADGQGVGGLLELEPPPWLPDSFASHCGACALPFKPLLRLRHHCRLCGKVYCSTCTSKRALLPPKFGCRCVPGVKWAGPPRWRGVWPRGDSSCHRRVQRGCLLTTRASSHRRPHREPQRVCEMCSALLAPLQPWLVGALSPSCQPPVHDAVDAIALRSWVNVPWSGSLSDDVYKAANMLRSFADVSVSSA